MFTSVRDVRFWNASSGPSDVRPEFELIIKHLSVAGSSLSGNLTRLGQPRTESSSREVMPSNGTEAAVSSDKDVKSLHLLMYNVLSPGRCGHLGNDVKFEMFEITNEYKDPVSGIALTNVGSSQASIARC